MDILHVDSVIKTFGVKQVLTDIYFECKTGEITGLLGRNGSGKSTLLRIIFGALQADRKFVKVNRKIINTIADRTRLINYLPQESFLPGHIKAGTVISVFCKNENRSRLQQMEIFKPFLKQKCRTLSSGEKRLLGIFTMIYSDTKFVLIDEPFNGVAPAYRDQIKEAIREQSATKGFVITDHDYRNIMDISTQTILLHDGGLRKISGPDDLKFLNYIPADR